VKPSGQFSEKILHVLRQSSGLRIQAGSGDHRFIGIWHVVVKDRVFVRSWRVKETGWYRTCLKEPNGAIQVGSPKTPQGLQVQTLKPVEIKAKRVRDTKLRDAIDRAYLEKYKTPGVLKYAKDLGSAKSRATTIELVPSGGENRARHKVKSAKKSRVMR
jgi:hypothetical protein